MSKNNGKKNKKKRIIIIGVGVVVVAGLIINSLFSSGEDVKLVDVDSVKREKLVSTLDISGTIGSSAKKVYASAVNADIEVVKVGVGDFVHKGDYLITYNTKSLENSYTSVDLQAKADKATADDAISKSDEGKAKKATAESLVNTLKGQIAAKQADINTLQQALTNYSVTTNNNTNELTQLQSTIEMLSRKKELSESEKQQLIKAQERVNTINNQNASISNDTAIIQADMQKKETEISDLQSQLAEAQSDEAAADAVILTEAGKRNLDYTSQASHLTVTQAQDNLSIAKAGITAENDGIVTEVQAIDGAAAVEGQSLVTVADSKSMQVEFQVSKNNLKDLKVGQKVKITSLGHEYKGKVERISKVATKTQSGSTMVSGTISIQNPDDSLVMGLDAQLVVTMAKEENALTVPLTAINTDQKGDFVYVVENNVIKRKAVEAGISSSNKIQILSGVKEGEKVVTTVDSELENGVKVVTQEAKGDVQKDESDGR